MSLKPPSDLVSRGRGRRLWRRVVGEFDLRADEVELLVEACRQLDLLELLRGRVERDGAMVETPQGLRVHPALVESRQTREGLRRTLGQLGLPDVDDQAQDDELRARRVARGA